MSTYHSPSSSLSYHPVSYAALPNRFSLKGSQKNPDKVPTAVQNLLISTKRLQEVLRLWSVEQASEGDVSDMYVQIGNEFNLTVSAFAEHQIDMRYVRHFSRSKICVAYCNFFFFFFFSLLCFLLFFFFF